MANAENVREVETASMNDIIDLNVGGTKFQTTRYIYSISDYHDIVIILFCQANIIARSQFNAGKNV